MITAPPICPDATAPTPLPRRNRCDGDQTQPPQKRRTDVLFQWFGREPVLPDLELLGPPLVGVDPCLLPLALEAVAAGFPSPAADYVEASIDLNVALVPRPSSTFFLRVQGDAMAAAGIHHGDLLVVDRSVEPRRGSTVVVVHAGQFLLRRLEGRAPRWRLVAADPAIAPLRLDGDDPHLLVWGVVIHAVHHLQRGASAAGYQNP